jgi:hypothetical protein
LLQAIATHKQYLQAEESQAKLPPPVEPPKVRPQTAKPLNKAKKATGKKKTDPVSRFKSIQNEWSKSKFL